MTGVEESCLAVLVFAEEGGSEVRCLTQSVRLVQKLLHGAGSTFYGNNAHNLKQHLL